MTPLPPGSTIGILGGGQLGRMLSLAASRLGLRTHIFDPAERGPASDVSFAHTCAEWDDADALDRFAGACDAVTYEWENVPVQAARVVDVALGAKEGSDGGLLTPGVLPLATAQDRLVEKTFLSGLPGVKVAPFKAVPGEGSQSSGGGSVHELRRAVRFLGLPCVLKTRRGGYDGKGQRVLRTEDDIAPAWEALKAWDLVLEGFVEFSREVSVICVRGADGEVASYPLVENVHRDAVLHCSVAPAVGDTGDAARIASDIVNALDYVGVIGVEFFDTRPENDRRQPGRGRREGDSHPDSTQRGDRRAGDLIVNEIAPRVHNSGHWTQDAGCVDQFENHIRAVAGWPLGSTQPRHAVRMTNLIGENVESVVDWATQGARVHLYGKRKARPGRKMGHVNEVVEARGAPDGAAG